MSLKSRIWIPPDQEFIEMFNKSVSISDFLGKLGFSAYGSSRITLRKRCDELGLDFSNKAKQGQELGRSFRRKVCLDNVFVENSNYSRRTVRRIIIRDNLIPYICQICGQEPIWNEKPMSLILDHINGKNNDHRLENLRFVCSNCNIQLDTFGSKSWCL